ncbi:MAG: nuclear transport factor 2 family protein [Chthoniobacterales bacterium]|nr:nuclear transport factor 2 family protein [Chthoniobacterales bacterium]
MVNNDSEAIGRLVSEDWIVIDADGGVMDRERFLGVIRTGLLSHDRMESDDLRVRLYGECGVVIALTRTKGKFAGTRIQHV